MAWRYISLRETGYFSDNGLLNSRDFYKKLAEEYGITDYWLASFQKHMQLIFTFIYIYILHIQKAILVY